MKQPVLRIWEHRKKSGSEGYIQIYPALIGEVDLYTSLRWQGCTNMSGSFELHAPFSPEAVQLLQVDRIVELMLDRPERYGIITCVEFSLNESGQEEITVLGKMISYLLAGRIVCGANAQKPYSTSGTLVNVMSAITACGTCDCYDSKYEGFSKYDRGARQFYRHDVRVLETDTNGHASISYSNSPAVLLDELSAVAVANDAGFFVNLDTVTPQLELQPFYYKENRRVLFDPAIGNVITQKYVQSSEGYKNALCYYSQGGANFPEIFHTYPQKTRYSDGDSEMVDVNRREVYSSEIVTAWSDIRSKLDGISKKSCALEADVTDFVFHYMQDYTLGDIVTVQNNKWGIAQEMPITSATEVWEDGYHLTLEFGKPVTTIYRRIREQINNEVK